MSLREMPVRLLNHCSQPYYIPLRVLDQQQLPHYSQRTQRLVSAIHHTNTTCKAEVVTLMDPKVLLVSQEMPRAQLTDLPETQFPTKLVGKPIGQVNH